MYITTNYNASAYSELVESTSAKQKSLVDYLTDDDSSSKSSFDSVSLSAETYAAIKENNPDLLTALGYDQDADSSETTSTSSSSSLLDKVQLSAEAYAVLKETNPEVLEALGYDLSADETVSAKDEKETDAEESSSDDSDTEESA
ncbi:hypothetical protein Dacet_1106 [Denitrovibrio acetiphilus DSM 12809]|uniref:Uncharacterized protein n=1 Tax=Denitrovibrio acetiphilus (strain DSM 12809 / NBRC 114555 / N2460) TaxID=522772 RepID=D4H779_DENA2|nr:hypothetical protein [Denitrovibrio acetiphilus]ADD67878.1 hypothetical protein Dacet_1106 [Denitrovibrio acetiphilus DSM 12809]